MYRYLLTILFAFLSFMMVEAGSEKALEGRQKPMSKKEQQFAKTVKLTFADAKKIALEKAPGTIFDWELEKEDGEIIYSIRVQLPEDKQNCREVNIDAMNGKVVEVEKENLQRSLKQAKTSTAEEEDHESENDENEKEDDDR